MSSTNPGALYLLPVPLGSDSLPDAVLPPPVLERTHLLRHFVAERAKSARAFLKAAAHPLPLPEIAISELNQHTPENQLSALAAPLFAGADLGLLSEAGCPAVADPGARLVALAHAHGIAVRPLIGPSAILLALMASGLDGQNFAFHGYLPAKEAELTRRLGELEADSRRSRRSQIFIETPYRNRQMFATLCARLAASTRLCVATDLSLASESVRTQSIGEWRRLPPPDLDRRPSVFLFLA